VYEHEMHANPGAKLPLQMSAQNDFTLS